MVDYAELIEVNQVRKSSLEKIKGELEAQRQSIIEQRKPLESRMEQLRKERGIIATKDAPITTELWGKDLEIRKISLEGKHGEIQKLKDEKQVLKEKNGYNSKIDSLSNKIALKEKELEELNNRFQILTQLHNELVVYCDQIKSEMAPLEQQLKPIDDDLKKLEERIKTVEEKIKIVDALLTLLAQLILQEEFKKAEEEFYKCLPDEEVKEGTKEAIAK